MKNKHKDLKISFNDEFNRPKYSQEYYWGRGYTMPIEAVSRLLGVSNSWISHTLLKQIKHVVYNNKFIWAQNKGTCLTYISKDDLIGWIIAHSSYQIQTEIVDLAYYLSPYKSVLNKAYSLYKEKKETNGRGYRVGTIPPEVLKYINEELLVYGAEQNYPCDKRRNIPWKRVEPFNILEKDFYNAKDEDHSYLSRETIYRNAFLHGDVKVNLSSQITIFVESNKNTEKMKMPYLIPYGKTIYVKGKKGIKNG